MRFQGNMLKIACKTAQEMPYHYKPQDYEMILRYNREQARRQRGDKGAAAVLSGMAGTALGGLAGYRMGARGSRLASTLGGMGLGGGIGAATGYTVADRLGI